LTWRGCRLDLRMVIVMSKARGGGKGALRMTRQRRAILETLAGSGEHPTADEVYRLVRRRMPRMSLGTVYRNLEVLSERGLIQKLEVGGARRRFDGKTGEHYHVRCVECNRVGDVSVEPAASITGAVRGAGGYEILGHRLEFVGLCPKCSGRRSESNEGGPEKGRRER